MHGAATGAHRERLKKGGGGCVERVLQRGDREEAGMRREEAGGLE